MKHLLFFSFLMYFSFISCNSNQPSQPVENENKELKITKTQTETTSIQSNKIFDSESYTISYPSNWELNQLNKYSEAIIMSDKSATKFKKNISVQITRIGNSTLDEMLEKYKKEIHAASDKAKILESERLERDGIPYYQIVYTSDAFMDTKNFNQYWVKGDKCYFLSFTSTPEGFDNYREKGLEILNSFKIK